METVLAFIAGFLFTWPALVILFVLGVWSEYTSSRKLAVFFAIVAAVVAYFTFHLPLLTIAYFAGGYLAIGILWSFWRYKRHADKVVEECQGETNSAIRARAAENLRPSKMLPTITAWIVIWPFSAVENIAGDLIKVIETLIKKVFHGVYNRIYQSAVSRM